MRRVTGGVDHSPLFMETGNGRNVSIRWRKELCAEWQLLMGSTLGPQAGGGGGRVGSAESERIDTRQLQEMLVREKAGLGMH